MATARDKGSDHDRDRHRKSRLQVEKPRPQAPDVHRQSVEEGVDGPKRVPSQDPAMEQRVARAHRLTLKDRGRPVGTTRVDVCRDAVEDDYESCEGTQHKTDPAHRGAR